MRLEDSIRASTASMIEFMEDEYSDTGRLGMIDLLSTCMMLARRSNLDFEQALLHARESVRINLELLGRSS